MEVKILKQESYHFLWMDGECWMWDLPEERRQQKEIADQAHGKVLVADYGFGLVQEYLLQNRNVTEVTTLEKHIEVMTEWQRVFGVKPYGRVIIGDFFDWEPHPEASERYDCVIGDIWVEVSRKYLLEYMKYVEKAETLITYDGKVLAWGSECFEVWAQEWWENRKCLRL